MPTHSSPTSQYPPIPVQYPPIPAQYPPTQAQYPPIPAPPPTHSGPILTHSSPISQYPPTPAQYPPTPAQYPPIPGPPILTPQSQTRLGPAAPQEAGRRYPGDDWRNALKTKAVYFIPVPVQCSLVQLLLRLSLIHI